jgi:hypothetical protein
MALFLLGGLLSKMIHLLPSNYPQFTKNSGEAHYRTHNPVRVYYIKVGAWKTNGFFIQTSQNRPFPLGISW